MPMTPEDRRARLVGRRQAKIVWNKAALDALQAGMADGLIELGEAIISEASANAPRDPAAAQARGVPMMADTGFVSVWSQGRLVHGSAEVAASRNKPRGLKVPKDQVVMVAAFASPIAHFNELGTIKMVAHPFLLPAFSRRIPGAEKVLIPAMGKRARAVR